MGGTGQRGIKGRKNGTTMIASSIKYTLKKNLVSYTSIITHSLLLFEIICLSIYQSSFMSLVTWYKKQTYVLYIYNI